jgi:formylglycine-generating enzyme required for sulfatase activity
MTAIARHPDISLLSLALPILATLGFAAGSAALLGYFEARPAVAVAAPASITIPAGLHEFRDYGEFYKNGYAVDAPTVRIEQTAPLAVMKYQVTEGEYRRCALEGQCRPVDAVHVHGDDVPVTGVSFGDAEDYARWLTAATGEVWRLPTHEELAIAAGSKFPDDALGIDPDSRNPSLRWIADYEREARRKTENDPLPKTRGHYGENEFGLADMPGNIWEWTTTCQRRVDLAGDASSTVSTCGIYVTVGPHRAPMSAFVRDPKTGGCSVGTPPANLGFRLIRDDRWYADLLRRLRERGILS